jgi:hypothetical protein
LTQLPLNDAIPRFKANEERVDLFVNGNTTQSYVSSNGVSVSTIPKFLVEQSLVINAYMVAQTALIVASANTAVNAANNATAQATIAVNAKVAAETARDQTLAVAYNAEDFATFAQGAKADTAIQAADLKSMAYQNSAIVSITGGSVTGIVDLAVADGGTGSSTATGARANLGIGTIATQNANNVTITGGSISSIVDLAIADGGTGASDAVAARLNLGLGSIATQHANTVTITGGSISGITDITVADGGTGASTAAGARTNLDVPSNADLVATAVAMAIALG